MAAALRRVLQFFLGQPWPSAPTGARSDFLFVQPNMLHGMARTLDLCAVYDLYNISSTPAHADANALMVDFLVIGDDLRTTVREWHEHDDDPAKQIPLPLIAAAGQRARVQAAK